MTTSQNNAPTLKAWLLLLLLALVWGSSFLLIKKGLLAFSPDQLAAIRIASAGFVLLPFILHRFKTVRPYHWIRLLSVGLVGSFIPAFLFAFAQTQLPSGVTGVLNTFTPLATLMLGVFLFKQSVRPQGWLGVLIGLAGTLVLVTASTNGEFEFNLYGLLIILATVCYGLNLNLIKHQIPDLGALTITGVSLFIVAPAALVYLLLGTPFIEQVTTQPETWFPLSAIMALGIFGTAGALVIFNTVVKLTDTTFSSSVTYLIPMVALMLGVLDGEPFLAAHAAGMAAILIGVWVANRRSPKRKSPA